MKRFRQKPSPAVTQPARIREMDRITRGVTLEVESTGEADGEL
jgi:hypothetical protein